MLMPFDMNSGSLAAPEWSARVDCQDRPPQQCEFLCFQLCSWEMSMLHDPLDTVLVNCQDIGKLFQGCVGAYYAAYILTLSAHSGANRRGGRC